MEFLHPYALFGLLAISIPIIIHLFNFRRYKKLYFTNLAFLKNVRNETRKQHKIRHLLVLISRILAIIFLVLAFARPYIPGPGGEQKTIVRYVDIYLDNSMSMKSALNGTSLLEISRAKALEVIDAYGPSDRFSILTNDFEGRHQRYYNKDEVLAMLPDVNISPAFRSIPDAYERMRSVETVTEDAGKHRYFISDFQRASYADGIQETDTSDILFYLPIIEEAFGNIYIDSCWFETPYNHVGQQQLIHARIVNASSKDMEMIPVRLMVDGTQRALGSVDVKANAYSDLSLSLMNNHAGWHTAEIRIEDHPITWDDNFFLSWMVTRNIPVLLISEVAPGFYFTGILAADSAFIFSHAKLNSLDYSSFSDNSLIVLDNIGEVSSGLQRELDNFVSSGGSLLVVPSQGADLNSINALLSTLEMGQLEAYDTSKLEITGLDVANMLFTDVFEDIPENLDLPVVTGHYPTNHTHGKYTEVIMDMQNGDPYFWAGTHGNGKCYVLATPLGDPYGNLARHAIWVPILYRMVMLSTGIGIPYYFIGKDELLSTEMNHIPEEKPFQLRLKGGDYSFIPAYQRAGEYVGLLLFDMISIAGHYEFGSEEEFIAGFSFNYDRLESDPAVVSLNELAGDIEDQGLDNVFVVESADEQVSASIAELSQGKSLWKTFIFLALLFILFEILLLRLFRK